MYDKLTVLASNTHQRDNSCPAPAATTATATNTLATALATAVAKSAASPMAPSGEARDWPPSVGPAPTSSGTWRPHPDLMRTADARDDKLVATTNQIVDGLFSETDVMARMIQVIAYSYNSIDDLEYTVAPVEDVGCLLEPLSRRSSTRAGVSLAPPPSQVTMDNGTATTTD